MRAGFEGGDGFPGRRSALALPAFRASGSPGPTAPPFALAGSLL